jgi:uncharacterized protein
MFRAIKDSIYSLLFQDRLILIDGPRGSGKTFFINDMCVDLREPFLFLDGDDLAVREKIREYSIHGWSGLLAGYNIVVFDDAQRIENSLFIIHDILLQFPSIQFIVSGSSIDRIFKSASLQIPKQIASFTLFPFSFIELAERHGESNEIRLLEERLLYGSLPEVIDEPEQVPRRLAGIVDDVLCKDLFANEKVKKPGVMARLMRELAKLTGCEISYNKIAREIDIDKETVERYVELLEEAFVIYRLNSFYQNAANELRKSRKIYFHDNGIRNAILADYRPLSAREDASMLWENYLIAERIKLARNSGLTLKTYFWRTLQKQSVSYLEDDGHTLRAYNFSWEEMKSTPKLFLKVYPEAKYELINAGNYPLFLKNIENAYQNENISNIMRIKTNIIVYSDFKEEED